MFAKWLGHSTVWIRIAGMSILTDPVFSARVGIRIGPVTIGPKRLQPPAMSLAEIPKPDLILLSHAHFDHFDIPSLRALEGPHTHVVTAAKTGDLLRPRRYASVTELNWGGSTRLGSARVSAFEVRHWGARLQTDRYRGYNGYAVEVDGRRILFGGDTALTDAFRGLKSSHPWDLAILPIGAYDPWLWAHCTPEQAWRMGNDAGAEFLLPVHHQTFTLSREPLLEPIQRLQAAAGPDAHRLALTSIGGEFRM